MKNLPTYIVLLPLCSALLSLALSKIHKHLGRDVVFGALAGSLVLSVVQLVRVIQNGPIHYVFGGYKIPYGIEFSVDTINAVIVIMVCTLGFLSCMFAFNFDKNGDALQVGGAYTMHALLVLGMVGMTMTGDVFNLYVFLEITSLTAYCLIAMGGSRGIVSAFRYLLVGTVAATFYLLGVGILYSVTGTLNMSDMAACLKQGNNDSAMLMAMMFLIAAFGIKMALFPFHGWQPSAYTHAHTGARPLIAGAMGKIPAYAMFRYLYCIYGKDFKYFQYVLLIIGVISVCGMIYGSVRAMAQKDIRKVLAYSSVAQIGYISLGFAIGSPLALAGAFLHMLGHAFMKGGLFFAAGAISWKYGTFDLNDFGRIYKKMPFTAGLLTVGALSMIGIPPTVGFFSKWYLACGAAQTHEYVYIFVLVLSSLLNAVYFFKVIEKVFVQADKNRKPLHPEGKGVTEAPISIMIPVVTCILMILLLGVFNVKVIDILLISLKGVAL